MDSMDSMSAAGGGRGGNPVVRAIGVSPALSKEAPETWFHGHKWPPGDVLDGNSAWGKRLGNVVYPDGAWSSRLLAIAAIGEFVQAEDADGKTWTDFALPDYRDYPLADELDELAELIEYRPGVIGEALAQRNNIPGYFRELLSFSPGSHPKTSRIVTIAMQIAQFQALWHKAYWNRPRPSQLYPVLLPPIDVPGACRLSERPRHRGPPPGAGPGGDPAGRNQDADRRRRREAEPAAAADAGDGAAHRAQPRGPGPALSKRHAAGKALAEFTFPLLMACDQVSRHSRRCEGRVGRGAVTRTRVVSSTGGMRPLHW